MCGQRCVVSGKALIQIDVTKPAVGDVDQAACWQGDVELDRDISLKTAVEACMFT